MVLPFTKKEEEHERNFFFKEIRSSIINLAACLPFRLNKNGIAHIDVFGLSEVVCDKVNWA